MRVLMTLSTSSVTGPAEVCLDDARGLVARGHQVEFACDTRRPGNYAEAIERAGFTIDRSLALCPKPRPDEVARDAWRLRRRFAAGEFDLVHARFSHDHAVALLAASGLSASPKVVRSVEIARSLQPGVLRSWSLRRSDGLVVAASGYRDRLVADHRVDPGRVEVIPGRVDAQRFSPGDPAPFRRRLGIGSEAPLVGIISRIKEDRRHVRLVRAFARVVEKVPAARLAVVGRGEAEPQVRAEVSRSGIEREVAFAGYAAGGDLVEAYRGCDVLVWLAEGNDGTCRAVLEAMACGKPVVAGKFGAAAEAVHDGVTGLLVDPDDERALAEALTRLVRDEGLRSRAGPAARQRAVERFAPELRAQRLVAFYERLLAQDASVRNR